MNWNIFQTIITCHIFKGQLLLHYKKCCYNRKIHSELQKIGTGDGFLAYPVKYFCIFFIFMLKNNLLNIKIKT